MKSKILSLVFFSLLSVCFLISACVLLPTDSSSSQFPTSGFPLSPSPSLPVTSSPLSPVYPTPIIPYPLEALIETAVPYLHPDATVATIIAFKATGAAEMAITLTARPTYTSTPTFPVGAPFCRASDLHLER